jgi:hypothetical protein
MILEKVFEKTDSEELMFMEVSEDNNPRLSFDINVYKAELPLAEMVDLLKEVADYFSVTAQRWSGFLETLSSERLGHISGGVGRNGKEFFTVYYSIEGEKVPTS